MAIFLAILALSLMIIVHEGGHYFVAKWSGMRVDRFSLGFGPALLKWQHKGTQFQIAPILFGGFVHIVGMNPHEEYDEKDPSVYPNRPTILRFLTIFAGPFTNMLFAIVLIFAVFAIAGVDVRSGRPLVSSVVKDSVADGQLQVGDVIETLNGQPVTLESVHTEVQRAAGAPLAVKVLRAGQEKQVTLTPRFQDEKTGWLLGISMGQEVTHQQLGLGRAAVESFRYPVVTSKRILAGLWSIISGKEKPVFQGPVDITGIISDSIESGWVSAFELLAALNVYLCIFNLLPFPALDGGRLAFLSYELATRRRPNAKIETAVHLAGGLVLVILMVVVTYKEVSTRIIKLFG